MIRFSDPLDLWVIKWKRSVEVKEIFAIVKQLKAVVTALSRNCLSYFATAKISLHFYSLSAVHSYDLYHIHFTLRKHEKSMILWAHPTSRSREQSPKRRSRSENMWKVCLFYSQNNKIIRFSNRADTSSQGAQRYVGFFFSSGQLWSYHVACIVEVVKSTSPMLIILIH